MTRPRKRDRDPPADIAGYNPIATAAAGQWFDWEAAELVCLFVENYCCHVKGQLAGKPLELEKWQREIYLTLFGWKNADGTRRYRTCFLTVARKNSKTTHFDAPIGLYLTGCDHEPGAEVYATASKLDQAAITWKIAAAMVKRSPVLQKQFEVIDSKHTIVHEKSLSFFRALPEDDQGAHGTNPHGVLSDELHVTTRKMVEAMESGLGARSQPLVLFTTTAGNNLASIWYEKLTYARRVRDGSQLAAAARRRDPTVLDDPTFLPVIYEVPQTAEWKDKKLWKLANPNLGKSVSVASMEKDFAVARASPLAEHAFRQLRLNQVVKQRLRFISMDDWEACYLPPDQWPDLAKQPCYGGVDLSSNRDLTALVLLFEIDGVYYVKGTYLWPADSIREREAQFQVPLQRWAADKHLLVSERQLQFADYDLFAEQIKQAHRDYKLLNVGIDAYNAGHLMNDLDAYGIEVVPVPQTTRGMNEATKKLDELIGKHQLRHDGNPVLTWCADNVEVIPDGNGNVRPIKPLLPGSVRSLDPTKKIDAIVALINALARAVLSPPPAPKAYAGGRELRTL